MLTVGVGFDMEKAYDMTWKYGITRDLYRSGIRGRMGYFVKNFHVSSENKRIIIEY